MRIDSCGLIGRQGRGTCLVYVCDPSTPCVHICQSSFVRAASSEQIVRADGSLQMVRSRCFRAHCAEHLFHSNCCKADFVERPSQSRFIIPDLLELNCQRRCFRTDCSKRVFCQNRILRAPVSEQMSESSFIRADLSEKMFQSKLCRADSPEQSWQ